MADDRARQGGVPIVNPSELAAMSYRELAELARMIRDRMLEVVSVTGGHLAPNLGVVELTLALHRAFESPRDQIVWDVGHQSYVHKLLTGRWHEFGTLRQPGGVAGFPRRSESPHDIFETGHASTSISAALGLAKARDLLGEAGHVVAVIGDGALTGGMAFEALNNLGHARTRLIVILNDNSMSISRSVGGIAVSLNRARTHPWYFRTKQDLKGVLGRLPGGTSLTAGLSRLRTSLKYLLIPGILFEELGLTYLGPIDGHNLQQLDQVLEGAKSVQGPVIIHCLTQKGKGYLPAEADPNRFHGIGPFDRKTGKPPSSAGPEGQDCPLTFSDAFGQSLTELARQEPRICAVTAAMPDGTGLSRFIASYPSRAFDVGIAEGHAVTFAAGLASRGMRPVVAIYSTFMQRAYDQALHDVCLQGLPVVFALDRAGIVGEDGPTHHGAYDLAYMRTMPGIVMAVPRDAMEMREMLGLALAGSGPFALRYPRGVAPRPLELAGNRPAMAVGQGQLLRPGTDAAVMAVGPLVYASLEAAQLLADEGLDVAVVDARFVKPLDSELLLDCASKTGRVLTVEDGIRAGGFGAAVLELLAARGLTHQVRVRMMGLPEQPVAHGPAQALRSQLGLDAQGIAAAIRQLVGSRA